jgi:hypothetical protein
MKKKTILIGCGILLAFISLLAVGTTISPASGILIEISGNNEFAQALCFGKNPRVFDEVMFKGPSGSKIMASRSKDEDSFGLRFTFQHVDSKATLKIYMSTIFYDQNLPIPIIYIVNGTPIVGFGDGGAKEKDLLTAMQKEFEKLPAEFREALREFYLFTNKSNIGLLAMSSPLSCIFGKQAEPYSTPSISRLSRLSLNVTD